MALAGIAAGVGAAVKGLGGLFGGSKDPGRLEANARWEREALAGNENALLALKHMSGKYGPNPRPLPGYCDEVGSCAGWGSETAKADALVKYQTVLARRGLQQIAGEVVGEFERATDTKVVPTRTLTAAFVVTVLAVGIVSWAVASNWKGGS